ncbi:MAG: SDR family oxidoreductase [Bacteroidota bacterium]|nr:SDR family oxidoreductase [Bacteroidota bacterium]
MPTKQTLYLTGSSGALGSETRGYFLERGWNVAGFDAIDDGFENKNFFFQKIDSTSELSVQTAFESAVLTFGPPRTLFATIGGLRPWSPHQEISIEDFRFITELNLISTFTCVKHATKLMKLLSIGSIITMGAETALHPDPNKSAYVAAKSAVIGFTRAIALETKEYGVNANCIVPTVIHTKANESWGSPDEFSKWTKPEDIAALCLFLSSEAGRAINGSILRVPNKM